MCHAAVKCYGGHSSRLFHLLLLLDYNPDSHLFKSSRVFFSVPWEKAKTYPIHPDHAEISCIFFKCMFSAYYPGRNKTSPRPVVYDSYMIYCILTPFYAKIGGIAYHPVSLITPFFFLKRF